MVTANLIAQLKRDEGLRLRAYVDSRGFITIGYGHNLSENPISLTLADQWLSQDAFSADLHLQRAMPWTQEFDEARLGVLQNMEYNLGNGRLLTFDTFLTYMRAKAWAAAADDLGQTKWATQVGERAARLQKQLITGEWQ